MAKARAVVATEDKEMAAKVRTYLAAQPPNVRRELRKLQSTIRATAPGAVQWFSYGIPGYKFQGRPLVWFAGWREHTSMYPITPGMKEGNEPDLEKYQTAKGTVRFPLSEPLPLAFVKRLVKARVAEIRAGKR